MAVIYLLIKDNQASNVHRIPTIRLGLVHFCRVSRIRRRRIVTQKNLRPLRRNFLLTVGAGGVAAATALVAGKKTAGRAKGDGGKRDTRGYQASAHVNNYYRTAKI